MFKSHNLRRRLITGIRDTTCVLVTEEEIGLVADISRSSKVTNQGYCTGTETTGSVQAKHSVLITCD